MINAVSQVAAVSRGARLAHAIVQEQLAALLAPLYLVRHVRRGATGTGAVQAHDQSPVHVVTVTASASTRS